MKLVIIGAGASFDSIYDFYDEQEVVPWRPPLANEIFDTRINFRNIIESYPGGSYYISQLNGVPDVEIFFQKQWELLKKNRADDLAAVFINLNYCLSHLFFEISHKYRSVGLNNYDVLVQKAYEYAISKKEEVMFVSFNYDTLLEQSFSKIFLRNSRNLKIEDYINFPIKIIKPHGSCNWIRTFKHRFKTKADISIAQFLVQEKISIAKIEENLSEKTIVSQFPANGIYVAGPNMALDTYPQILIPLRDKDQFVLPQDHYKYFINNLSNVTDIMIIGWKGMELSFQKELNNHVGGKKISILSVNAADDSIERTLNKCLQNAKFQHYSDPGSITRFDNTKVLINSGKTRFVQYKPGSFSAYTVNVLKGNISSFFEVK